MFFEALIALRQFKAKRSQTLKLVTWLALCGIAMGVVALVGGVALTSGFERAFQEKLTGLTAHVMVREYGFGFESHQTVERKLREVPEVVGVSPVTHHFALAVGRTGSSGVMVRGIEPKSARQTLNLDSWMLEGDLSDLRPLSVAKPGTAILGKALASKLGVKKGEPVTVLVTQSGGKKSAFDGASNGPSEFTMVVGGVFEAGFGEFDAKVVYVHLATAQKIFDLGNSVNALEVRVQNPLDTTGVLNRIRAELDRQQASFQVLDWRQMNRNIFASLAYQKLAIVLVMLVMVFLAACNAACLLMMMINERVREIAILRAIGLGRGSVMRIFLIQSIGIGGGGTILGIVLSLVVLLNIFPSGIPVDPQVYAVDSIPLVISTIEIVYVGFGSLLVTIFASFLPAWNAAAMHPVDGLRERNQ